MYLMQALSISLGLLFFNFGEAAKTPTEMNEEQLNSYSETTLHVQAEVYGTARRVTTSPDQWYNLTLSPNSDISALSLDRNAGQGMGAVTLSPTGLTLDEAGKYLIDIGVILRNVSNGSPETVSVYLSVDDTFDPNNPSLIGGTDTFKFNEIKSLYATGILNLQAGSRLSLIATNLNASAAETFQVVSWTITVFKI